jgi:hypothetical protein
MTTNPFQSPKAPSTTAPDSDARQLLASVRPAVLSVAIASVVFTFGSVISAASVVWFYYPTFKSSNTFNDQSLVNAKAILMFAVVQQLIMSCGFGYLAMHIFGHAKAIRQATTSEPFVLDDVFRTQRSCWYCAATLCAVWVMLRVLSALIR